MTTYQDLEAISSDRERIEFVHDVILEHEGSPLYKDAAIADEYIRGQNREAKVHINLLITSTGGSKEDKWSPNNKTARSFFRTLVWGDVQYLLGNGIKWDDKEAVEKKLGRDFDNRIREMLLNAKQASQCFGFFNSDHLEVFPVRTSNGGFAPLYDEETGALRAGIQFWRRADLGTLKANLYEVEGITSFYWDKDNNGEVVGTPRKPYILRATKAPVDLSATIDYENYPSFPIIPMWGNTLKVSELSLGLKDLIDAYDRIENGYLNDIDNAIVYWIIKNAAGADNEDIAKFLDQLRSLKAANIDDAEITPVPVSPPVEAREVILNRLERAIYDDYMGLNFKDIVSGAATATQIRAAYEPVKTKASDTEQCVLDFLYKLMEVADIDDNPTFEPDPIRNISEETNAIVSAAQFMPMDYIVSELLYLRGDGDKVSEILDKIEKENMERMLGAALGGEGNEV